MTSEDKRAQIDRRFDETFAVFDERMRKEQETLSRERAAGQRGAGESERRRLLTRTRTALPRAARAKAVRAAKPSRAGSKVMLRAAAANREAAGEAAGDQAARAGWRWRRWRRCGGRRRAPARCPADIPDGSDDDIVARQLREAAMKETDPELRERLWEEYRQYKQSTQ